MNDQLIERIEEYVQLETNYAIILNGNYGIGKTYFIKNQLFPKIKDLKVPNSKKDETYIPILISLFGANSIDEIQNQIFIELYPILKNKGVKIFTGLGKSLYKFLSGSELKELLNDTNTSSSDLIDFSKILLCIDDIDRKSPTLDIKEFFGFVNNLVENQNAKILLVANEEELRNESNIDDNSYATLREKVIGVSITFKNSVNKIFDEIVKTKYKESNQNYFDFLCTNKNVIVTQIEKNKDNLRNLLFFLEHFKIIFYKANQLLDDDSKYLILRDQLMVELLKFALPISIEYKLGRLNISNFKQIEEFYNGFSFNLDAFLGKKEKSTEKTYAEIFKETYFEDNEEKKMYFKSAINYIMGKCSFTIEELVDDINTIFRFEQNTIPDRQKLIRKLDYWHCIDLDFNNYRKLTKQLIQYVDKGEYELEEYPTLFRYSVRFDNILNFNISKLIKRFKKGIDSGKRNYKYKRYLSFQISMRGDEEFFDEIKEIAQYCTSVNEEIQKNEHTSELELLFNLYKNDFEQFIENIDDSSVEINFTPFFSRFDFKKFSTHFKQLSNKQIIDFGFYIDRKYSHSIYPALNPDKLFLQNLHTFILNEQTKQTTVKLKKVAYNFMTKKIEGVLPNFN